MKFKVSGTVIFMISPLGALTSDPLQGGGGSCNLMELDLYVSPAVMTLELYPEGVICGSNELLEENEGEW